LSPNASGQSTARRQPEISRTDAFRLGAVVAEVAVSRACNASVVPETSARAKRRLAAGAIDRCRAPSGGALFRDTFRNAERSPKDPGRVVG
jgi:hypothetical protein